MGERKVKTCLFQWSMFQKKLSRSVMECLKLLSCLSCLRRLCKGFYHKR